MGRVDKDPPANRPSAVVTSCNISFSLAAMAGIVDRRLMEAIHGYPKLFDMINMKYSNSSYKEKNKKNDVRGNDNNLLLMCEPIHFSTS